MATNLTNIQEAGDRPMLDEAQMGKKKIQVLGSPDTTPISIAISTGVKGAVNKHIGKALIRLGYFTNSSNGDSKPSLRPTDTTKDFCAVTSNGTYHILDSKKDDFIRAFGISIGRETVKIEQEEKSLKNVSDRIDTSMRNFVEKTREHRASVIADIVNGNIDIEVSNQTEVWEIFFNRVMTAERTGNE